MRPVPYLLPSFLLLVLPMTSRGECPHNAGSKAMECIGRMGDLGFNTKAEDVKAWDYQRTKIACDHGAFDIVLDCADRVVSQCTDEELNFLLDIPKMRKAVSKMCKSVDAMKPYVTCMHDQLNDVRRCAEEQRVILHTKLRAAGSNQHKRMATICSFTNNVYSCQSSPVRQYCGTEPADFLLDFMNAFRPPACPAPGGYNSSNQSQASKVVFLLPLILCAYYLQGWAYSKNT